MNVAFFGPFDLQELKECVGRLINYGTSFSVKLIVDKNNKPDHWEVEEI